MNQFLFFFSLLLCSSLILQTPALAADTGQPAEFRPTDLPLPRFVSLKADKIYVRTGPGLRYPLKWIYKQQGMPIEIIQEFDIWRKIRDFEGGEGWIHQSMLSGKRTAMVVADKPVAMRQAPGDLSRIVARLEPFVVAEPEKCAMAWCRIEVHGYDGWVERKFLWGIYDAEELD